MHLHSERAAHVSSPWRCLPRRGGAEPLPSLWPCREWQALAQEWDRLTGARAQPCLTACEADELRELSRKLREARLAGDLTALRFTLRMDLKRRSGYEAVQR